MKKDTKMKRKPMYMWRSLSRQNYVFVVYEANEERHKIWWKYFKKCSLLVKVWVKSIKSNQKVNFRNQRTTWRSKQFGSNQVLTKFLALFVSNLLSLDQSSPGLVGVLGKSSFFLLLPLLLILSISFASVSLFRSYSQRLLPVASLLLRTCSYHNFAAIVVETFQIFFIIFINR